MPRLIVSALECREHFGRLGQVCTDVGGFEVRRKNISGAPVTPARGFGSGISKLYFGPPALVVCADEYVCGTRGGKRYFFVGLWF